MENERDFNETIEEILEILEQKQYVKARDELLKNNEVDIAEILEEVLEELDVETTIIVFRMLPKNVSVEVFSYLPSEDQVEIIQGITEREISYIIEELDFDDKIDVLEELPANLVDKILEKTPKEERKLINTFLNYPENSAGSLMTPDYISLQNNMTVGEALAYIKKEGMDSETVYTCYVKEAGRKLEGIVSLRALVIHDEDTKISEMMSTEYVYVNVNDDQEEVSEAFKKYGFLAIPVVDKEHRLVGIITVDDILDVIEEETTEDIERMAGVIDGSDTEYLDMGVFRHAKNRLPWLILLSVSLMITGTIIEQFEATLQQVVALTFYLPLLMGTGGNTGTQAATLVIRGISLGDIDLKDALRVFWKELRVSVILGVILSLFNFAKIIFIDHQSMAIAFTVCGSMLIVIMFAKLLGGMLPLLAKRLGVDPALMATPMISSLTDMVSALAYLAMATMVLGISL
ncbi:MAG: magnesium transporter [Firmicutes bacterium]|jgi:magnesium transporter|nr:magnesium transporter [Bacillota bacterium]NBI63356.1 magnesium transporter [Clostridiales bacterium]